MRQIQADRTGLERGLADLGIHHISSTAPFVLARPGVGVHGDLREQGIAVRRCDTFPGWDVLDQDCRPFSGADSTVAGRPVEVEVAALIGCA